MTESSSRATPRASLGAIVVAFTAGLLGGAAMFALLPGARPAASEAPLSIAGVDELGHRVQELTQEMQALRATPLHSTLPDASATRGSVKPLQSSTDADLRLLIAKLDELLNRSASLRELGVPAGAAPLAIPDSTRTEPARAALIAGGRDEVSSDNFLMTYQQIVERYGRPSAVWRDKEGGGVLWTYVARDGSDDQVTFVFIDGLVSSWQ